MKDERLAVMQTLAVFGVSIVPVWTVPTQAMRIELRPSTPLLYEDTRHYILGCWQKAVAGTTLANIDVSVNEVAA